MSSPLNAALEKALLGRQRKSVPVTDLYDDPSRPAADLFSNDYLSLCTNNTLRQIFVDQVSKLPYVFGTGGSRLMSGNAPIHLEFEDRMKNFFRAPAALLFNSGYDANVAFWHSVPQLGDAVVFDDLVHASTRDGLVASRARNALYPFTHNSVSSLRDTILHVLRAHPAVSAGRATLFIAVESLYSMDGDFAPLPQIVQLAELLIPEGSSHIVVDEAHSTGIYDTQGRGLVTALGLEKRVHTVLHTFGKARALTGAVLLTDPVIRKYIVNYGRPFIFSTSLSHSTICALNASFDYIESDAGAELISSLHKNSRLFEQKLAAAVRSVPSHLLSLRSRKTPAYFPPDIISPIFPVFTSAPIPLAEHLRALGYGARPVPFPIVPRGEERVRIVIHAQNTEEEFDELIGHILEWASAMQGEQKDEVRALKAVVAATSEASAKSAWAVTSGSGHIATTTITRRRISVDMSVRVLA
ncbi:PLP-dependent transferase [Fomes fomentarius]|nr:PLP-dependent transferase [Fomes fomentarius]